MVGERAARSSGGKLRSVHEAGKDDGTSALDIVVEEGVAVAEAVKEVEGLCVGVISMLN